MWPSELAECTQGSGWGLVICCLGCAARCCKAGWPVRRLCTPFPLSGDQEARAPRTTALRVSTSMSGRCGQECSGSGRITPCLACLSPCARSPPLDRCFLWHAG
eukprot:scaffold7991_cov106-Isochrysis_galbana.AAC.4